jgi:hypothetical protein
MECTFLEQPVTTDPVTLASLKAPPTLDPLALLEGDSLMRRIFLAYTVRIPWITELDKPISREDEACYLRVNTSKG